MGCELSSAGRCQEPPPKWSTHIRSPIVAPLIGQTQITIDGESTDVRSVATRFLRAVNVLGVPALVMPMTIAPVGLPVGVQLVGRWFDEAGLLRVAHRIEIVRGPFPQPIL